MNMVLNASSLDQFIPEAKKKISSKDLSQAQDNASTTMDAYKSVFKYQDKLEKLSPYHVTAAYASLYTSVKSVRFNITKSIDKVKYNYLVDTIVHQMSEDALTPEVGTDEILEIKSKNKAILKAVAKLEEIIDLDQLAKNIAPEAVFYGEYTLKTEINNNNKTGSLGITDLLDVVDQGSVVPLTKNGKQQGFLVKDLEDQKIKRVGNASYVKFILGGARIRVENEAYGIRVNNTKVQHALDKLPKFVRTGRSMIYPLLEKIKELELLEKLVPATKLSKMSSATLIGLSVPNNQEIDTAMAATRKIEGLINRKLNVDPISEELTVEDILATTGKMKVVPLFGEKGTLEKLDFKSDEPDDLLGSVKDIRETITESIGIVLYSTEDNKLDSLRRNSRYINRLKNIQRCISDGVKQLIYIHLVNSGITFKKEDVEIVFRNTLPNIDNIDRLEHADITVSALENVKSFFVGLMEEDSPFAQNVNKEAVLEYLDNNLKTIGLANAIIVKDIEPEKTEEPEDKDDEVEDEAA